MIINFVDDSEKLEKLKKYYEQINLTQTAVTKQEDIESIKTKFSGRTEKFRKNGFYMISIKNIMENTESLCDVIYKNH